MLIKVCGMRHAGNIAQLSLLRPDYMGFIFFGKSPRYAGEMLKADVLSAIPANIIKTGVFVNASFELVLETVTRFGLDAVQLHGDESPDMCGRMKATGVKVFKAFHPKSRDDFDGTQVYEAVCDYFLFDTPSVTHGGSGRKFDWSLLDEYTGSVPFFLSGGIDVEDLDEISALSHPQLAGLDLNSRFEIVPALKNIPALRSFLAAVKS
ncbi:phosphoribosylanthranilate isomerase [Geofilum sp. OHC36d9]|uniref:phosphoribosylanthranilate isomerase n=1 Tax=Geofilum sp. OHC36d9 TaxID=3458413 RepID=UPI004034C5CE